MAQYTATLRDAINAAIAVHIEKQPHGVSFGGAADAILALLDKHYIRKPRNKGEALDLEGYAVDMYHSLPDEDDDDGDQ